MVTWAKVTGRCEDCDAVLIPHENCGDWLEQSPKFCWECQRHRHNEKLMNEHPYLRKMQESLRHHAYIQLLRHELKGESWLKIKWEAFVYHLRRFFR